MIKITLPDNSIKEYKKGTNALEIAQSIHSGLAKQVLAATVNNEVCDLTLPINEDATLVLHKWDDPQAKQTFWHTSAHIMAEAIEAIFPGVKLAIGPSIENGFYYDIDFPEAKSISDKDFPRIEKKFLEIARAKYQLDRKEMSKDEALTYYKEKGDEYKEELISELEDGTITLFQNKNS